MTRLRFRAGRVLPVVMQTEEAECGLACLAMIASYHGHHVDINTLRGRYAISRHGVTVRTLMQIADRMELSCRALRLEPSELTHIAQPAVLHWGMNHFVVLGRVAQRAVVIHDPARGKRRLTYDEFNKHFTGVAIELRPAQSFRPVDEFRRLRLSDLWTRMSGFKRSFIQLLLLSLLLQLFSLALPFYSQLFIDDVLMHRDVDLLKVLAAGFLLVTLAKVVTELIRSQVVLYLSNHLSFQFAVNVLRHLLRLPVSYFSRRHMGDIVSRFGSLSNIKDFLASGIVEIVIDGVMVIGTLLLMFFYSVTLTMVASVAVIIYTLIRFFSYRAVRRRNEETIALSANENTTFMENIRAIQGIKLFGREADRSALWQNENAAAMNAGIQVQRLEIFIQFSHGLLVGVENIVLILMGGFAVLDGKLSVGMVVAYISYKEQFYSRVFALLDKGFEFRLLEVHLARLADIAFTEPERHMEGIGAPPREVCMAEGLTLRTVSYRFDEESPWLFRDVSLDVGPEESVAIIGPTGCGKSTLLKIVLSLVQPCAGEISMHGMPINRMGLADFRARVAGVLQDDTLLSGTLFDNITFFETNPDQERVEQAAHLAGIAKEIRALPMQYNTLVGNMGAALSGGQIQRVLLARAFYRRPLLLVMDEATSHLDVTTERVVNEAVRQLRVARIIVAHRPQAIRQADRIYRLGVDGLAPVLPSELDDRLEQEEKRHVML